MEMPIIDLSANRDGAGGQIDWSQEQPFGTWRCVEGWETDGYQCGCLKRATTETDDGDLRCTEHALLYELRQLRQTGNESAKQLGNYLCNIDNQMETIVEALWDINYTLMPMYRKLWLRIKGQWYERRRKNKYPRTDNQNDRPLADD